MFRAASGMICYHLERLLTSPVGDPAYTSANSQVYANRWPMPKISKSQLLRAISAAETARPQRANPFQATFCRPPRALSNQRALQRLLTSSLAKAGFDIRKVDQLRKQASAELQRIVQAERRDAVKRSTQAKAALKSHVVSRRKALDARLALPLAPPYPIKLDKPFLIWASPHSNIIYDSRIEPNNSWAKVKVEGASDSLKHGSEKLSFYFIWDNPSDYHAVINAATFLALTGYGHAYADGSFWHWYIGNSSSVALTAYLYVWEWWNQPPTVAQYDHDHIGGVGAHGGLTDDSNFAVFSGAYDLAIDQCVVAPRGTVVFEVALDFLYLILGGGSFEADFQYGSLDIKCPYIELSLLTAPPMIALSSFS
jgi:hypothetical protein